MFLVPRQNKTVWSSPVQEMDRLQRDMGRLFDLAFPGTFSENSFCGGAWMPAVDVLDKKEALVVKADLPGLSKEDINVVIENNILSIRGEKKDEKEIKDGDVLRSERYYGSFERSFTLPVSVDSNRVQAKFKDGVLELVIAKKEEAKARQIRVDVN